MTRPNKPSCHPTIKLYHPYVKGRQITSMTIRKKEEKTSFISILLTQSLNHRMIEDKSVNMVLIYIHFFAE